MVWRRVREGALPLPPGDAEALLRRSHEVAAHSAALHAFRLSVVLRTLRAAGVEPLVLKGQASARLYAEPALRPYGDLDLLVRAGDAARAAELLARAPLDEIAVDLHVSPADAGGRTVDELFARSRLVRLGAAGDVRVLGAEDHLRLTCLHLLRHGAWRPLWLCDVGAALEAPPAGGYDWDLVLRGGARPAEQVACAVGLATALLGARLPDDFPPRSAARGLPEWLPRAVLAQWGRPYRRYRGEPLARELRRPRTLLAALRARWPNPVEATVSVEAPFDAGGRLGYQLRDCGRRVAAAVGWD